MGRSKTQTRVPAGITEYLDRHPDVFMHHPELLERLHIPHARAPGTSSLIEYQVRHLLRQLDELRTTIANMEKESGRHKLLMENMQALALKLIAAPSARDLYNTLRRDLKSFFSANEVLLLVFTNADTPAGHAGLRFCSFNSRLRFMFLELFIREQPLCDSLQGEHLQALFGNNSEAINSTVMLPGTGHGWQGLLVLGSFEENRYCHGPELDTLGFINDIICRKISSWLGGCPGPGAEF